MDYWKFFAIKELIDIFRIFDVGIEEINNRGLKRTASKLRL